MFTRWERQTALSNDVLNLIDRRNRSRDGTLVLQSEYLEVVIELKR